MKKEGKVEMALVEKRKNIKKTPWRRKDEDAAVCMYANKCCQPSRFHEDDRMQPVRELSERRIS